jgi:hypothetical protein
VFYIVWRRCFDFGSLTKPFDSLRNRFEKIGGQVDKMRFYLKTLERTYGLKLRLIVKSFPRNVILASHMVALFSLYIIVLVEL